MNQPLPATADLTITVHGDPATQGSKQARPIYRGRGDAKVFTGRVAQVESNKEKHKSWREAVKTAALDAAGDRQPIDGPIRALVVFTVRKPDSAPKRRRTWPHRKPDIDKLLRSTFDALTDAGVWRDDSRVVDLRARKVFPGEDELALTSPGVVIRIWPLGQHFASTETGACRSGDCGSCDLGNIHHPCSHGCHADVAWPMVAPYGTHGHDHTDDVHLPAEVTS